MALAPAYYKSLEVAANSSAVSTALAAVLQNLPTPVLTASLDQEATVRELRELTAKIEQLRLGLVFSTVAEDIK